MSVGRPSQDREQIPPTEDRPVGFKVGENLLDLMAADDQSKLQAAKQALKEKRNIARAERYLRRKFRSSLIKNELPHDF